MKKMMKALHGKKGFTLIECVIAIAVFAALTGMVLMIMSQTIQLSKKATDAETDLNNLVENVVQDSTNKTFGADSKRLIMNFDSSSPNFFMSYSTVDGYKNFIECTSCKNHANNLDYMAYIYETNEYKNATDAEKESYKISYWFNSSSDTNYLQCPTCQTKIYDANLKFECLSCGETGAPSAFDYNKFSGSYTCKKCSGGNVVQLVKDASGNDVPITESPTADADFMVSGMVSNAIRYGEIPLNSKSDITNLMSSNTTDSKTPAFNTTWTYTPNKNASIPGVYTLNISFTDTITDGETATVNIKIPGGYYCSINKNGTTADGVGDNPYAAFYRSNMYSIEETDKPSMLIISGITNTKRSNIIVKFTLTNYANNNSFDADYANDTYQGLGGYWFGCSGYKTPNNFSVAYPRTDASIDSSRS